MNIIDYIKKHKDEDFNTYKFTEVDNLILSLLSYIDFTNIVGAFKKNKISLQEAAHKINQSKQNQHSTFFIHTLKMLNLMKDTKRYSNLKLYNYMKIVNKDMQFGALTIKLNDNSIFVSFAGTDTSIIGWEEDFKMAYLYPGASQKYAATYLNKTIGLFDRNISIGGHSKGGNLAICAAMNANFWIKRKIKNIYNNDGPGFLKDQVESKNYKSIAPKIKMYVPKESIIGMLLYNIDNYKVVKAKGFNIIQHNAFLWQCNHNEFISDIQSKRSKNLRNKLSQKLEQLPLNKRIEVITNLFNIFKKLEITDAQNIKIKDLFKLMKGFKELDKNTQNLLVELVIIIFIK